MWLGVLLLKLGLISIFFDVAIIIRGNIRTEMRGGGI